MGHDVGGSCIRGGEGGALVLRTRNTRPVSKAKGGAFKRNRAPKDAASSSSSSNSTTCYANRQQWKQRGVHLRSRRQRLGTRSLEDLALPLGMSFAAIVAKVLNVRNVSAERMSMDQLFTVVTGAVNESITNIYGDKFDCFLRNFEMSFRSTLKTLSIVNKAPTDDQENAACTSVLEDNYETADNVDINMPVSAVEDFRSSIHQTIGSTSRKLKAPTGDQENAACCSVLEDACETADGFGTSMPASFVEDFQVDARHTFGSTLKELKVIKETSCIDQRNSGYGSFLQRAFETAPNTQISSNEDLHELVSLNSMNNELVPHEHLNQQLPVISRTSSEFNPSLMNTFERSVFEQGRSNDLKALEIRLVMRKLQLKQSQLALNSYANLLEKIKIRMGISKASFREEKLKNQLEETRHAQLLKTLIDLLVAGLILMCGCLAYGTYTYSYQRITDATAACSEMTKGSSWWMPKSLNSLNSGWQMLRCHVTALSRLSFGILMILAIAYLVFQRSAATGSNMPITFLILLLGGFCGFAGKLCVDTLGGSGYQWLVYWEVFCVLHFFASVFPSIFYHILYGPMISQGTHIVRVPYWIRRYTVYTILLLILPTMTGLLPFASTQDWRQHFSEMLTTSNLGSDEL